MSFSLNFKGTIAGTRKYLHDYATTYEQPTTIRAINFVHENLNTLEASGATHVQIEANGHGGNATFRVSQDFDAELKSREEANAKAMADWEATGRERGYFNDILATPVDTCNACAPVPMSSLLKPTLDKV